MQAKTLEQEWWERLSGTDFDEREEDIKSEYKDALTSLAAIFFCDKEEFNEDHVRSLFYTLCKGLEVSERAIPKTEIRLMDKKKHDWEMHCKSVDARTDKEFITRNVKTLCNELYGDEPLDYFNITGSISNLIWNSDIKDLKLNKKLNIQRKA